MDKTFFEWAKANQDQALIQNGLLEPRYAHEGIGAAVVVRAALYFERAFDPETREAIAEIFDAFNESPGVKLTFLWHNGKAAQPLTKPRPLRALAASLGPEDRFDFDYVGGERATDASLWRFEVAGLRRWQEKTGRRGLNALSFSWPLVAVQEFPNAFAKLFFVAAQKLNAVHGQAGYAVNLSPTAPHENEATEFWIAQQMPGLDVGSPTSTAVRDLKGQIKTVNWLTAISTSMLATAGGLATLRSELPPSWYSIANYGAGVVIRAGVRPESGASESETLPPVAPPAYVVLDHALRAVRPESLGSLQKGTVNAGAPVYNTRASTEAWLRRFETDDNGLLAAKAALLKTEPLAPENELPTAD
ncbi:type VI immunity family protein [Burkholderia pseudomallei]|uniref:type VI immunity family protein n=1 Tax=Burkholderia pseudomallei TaxID=28450 RepID=UPI000F084E3C|nr:type VI immunity family protein [Burkholderia pseudomallei]CAJ3080097.1 gp30 [Burkholderia pseudomallei]VCK80314.1 gp30 [Burkholderia pseudomallei]VCK83537.1 gp30 [Burkholderia pseudomallei]VCK91525.1 gp30 [Burkholderia pseudomallei]VCK96832.1 gp30 [Burkholderia pseudomallei]